MNAKALLALIDECGMIELVNRSGRDSDGWIQETILRALRLLAAAEANDGSTPLTDAIVMNGPLTFGTQRAADAYDAAIDHSRTLEVERTGLAARVGELEAERDALKRHAEAMAFVVAAAERKLGNESYTLAAYRRDFPKE